MGCYDETKGVTISETANLSAGQQSFSSRIVRYIVLLAHAQLSLPKMIGRMHSDKHYIQQVDFKESFLPESVLSLQKVKVMKYFPVS